MSMQAAKAGRLASAVYEGMVTHCRHAPRPHAFSYRMAQLYLDLDELDAVFAGRWLWSVDRPNLAQWRRGDFLGPPEIPLAEAVRQRIRAECGTAPTGPIRMLTHLRYGGYAFNPVTFYYCYEAQGEIPSHVVAEITNTPWKERHSYVLPLAQARRHGGTYRWRFGKAFHVSPFMPMQCDYDWRFTPPADELHVHMRVLRGGQAQFDAGLAMRRRELDGASLARVLWRYPLMTAQVIGAIHWQALRLWLKRNPVHDHPRHRPAPLRKQQ